MFSIQRLESVRAAIAAACSRAGRSAEEVTLVGVTKNVSAGDIAAAYHAGLKVFGENRVQEASGKISELRLNRVEPVWHLIGHLQSNKAKKAVELFHVVQSVDSIHLAEVLSKQAQNANRSVEIFIQINTSGEASKFGAAPGDALKLAADISVLPNLRLTGLMTIGAFVEEKEVVRRCFRTLRDLGAEISAAGLPGVELRQLSMGMTDDFEIAIEEGSTMVRVGRAIFGER